MNNSNPETRPEVSSKDLIARSVISLIGLKNAFRLYEMSRWLPRLSTGFLARGIAGGVVVGGGSIAIENYSGRTALVQAAGCENPFLSMTFLYAPNPDKNPNGVVVTPESLVIPIDLKDFGSTELLYRPNPNVPVSKENPEKVISIDMDTVGDHGEGRTTIKEECNTTVNGKPGISFESRQSQDIHDYCNANGEQPRKPIALANGEAGYVVNGTVVKPSTIESLVKSTAITTLKKVGTVVIERLAQVLKVKPKFSAPEDKSKEYFAFFKQRAADIKAISANIQKREEECSKPKVEVKTEASSNDANKKLEEDLKTKNKNKELEDSQARNKQLEEEKKRLEAIATSSNTVPIAAGAGVGGIGLTAAAAYALKKKGII